MITPAAPKPTLNAPSQEIDEMEKAYEEVLAGNLAEVLARKKWLHMDDVDALYHPQQLEIAALQCGYTSFGGLDDLKKLLKEQRRGRTSILRVS